MLLLIKIILNLTCLNLYTGNHNENTQVGNFLKLARAAKALQKTLMCRTITETYDQGISVNLTHIK